MIALLLSLCAQDLPPEIAKWEPDVAALQARDAAEATPTDAVLFFGSSSIRLWDTIEEDMAPWPVVQRGYGGARMSDMAAYMDRVIGPRLGPDNPRRPRALCLFVANDIAGNGELDVEPGEVLVRFRRIHDYVRGRDATLPVFWIEVTPTAKRWAVWPKIEEAARLIRDRVAGSPNTYFIPTAGAYIGPDNRPREELFVEDKLHLNEAGYDLWGSLIKAKLHHELGDALPEEVTKYEDDIRAFGPLNETAPEDAVVFYGSSSIRLWETIEEDMAPLPVVARGYGGASLQDAALYAERVLGPLDARAVVLFVGGDVYLRGRRPEVAAQDFRRLLSEIRRVKGDVPVVWINTRPVLSMAGKWDEVRTLNRLISEAVAGDANAHVVDVNDRFLNEDGSVNADLFAEDRVHLNDAGYAAWTKALKTALTPILSEGDAAD